MHQLFIAIRPPQPVLGLLLDTMEGMASLRWQDADQLHITLRFIGEVERPLAEDIVAALATIRFDPFELRTAGVGRFDHRRGGVLWAGMEPRAPLAALAAKVERACLSAGIAPEQRAFHPHVTLARWSGESGEGLRPFIELNAGLRSEPFAVDRFALFESHLGRGGALHEMIADYPRGPA